MELDMGLSLKNPGLNNCFQLTFNIYYMTATVKFSMEPILNILASIYVNQ